MLSLLFKSAAKLNERIAEEEQRNKRLQLEYAMSMDKLKNVSKVLSGEMPEEKLSESEKPFLYLYKNSFVHMIEDILIQGARGSNKQKEKE